MSAADRSPHVHTALFGGTGEVRVWDLLRGGSAAPFTAVLRCELAPGGSVGAHRQQADPEIIVGLGGSGRAVVDGAAHPLGRDAVVHLPLGSVLSVENLGDEPLRYLIVKASG